MATVYPVPDPRLNLQPYATEESFDNEQEILRLLSRGGGVQQVPQQAPAAAPQAAVQRALPRTVESLSGRGGDLHSRGMALAFQEPNTSALQEYARQRGEQGNAAMLNALAAQFAGESFAPMQAHFLKKAAAAQDPMKLSGGILTAEGKFLKDPFAEQDKKANMMLQLARHYEQMAVTAQTAQERAAALRAQQDIQNQLRLMGLQIQQDRVNQNQGGTFNQSGFTPDGKLLVTNKTGMNFILEMGPQGQPVYTPYSGPMTPKATWEKNVAAVQEATASADRASNLLKMVDENPKAFGIAAQAVSSLPPFMQGRVGAMVLDEDTLQNRSQILRQAAMEISSLYGAALSLGEQARANTFIPNKDDGPEVLIAKLRAARDWAESTAKQYGGGVRAAAQARMNPTAGAVPADGGPKPGQVQPPQNGLSDSERAELDALRKKHGR